MKKRLAIIMSVLMLSACDAAPQPEITTATPETTTITTTTAETTTTTTPETTTTTTTAAETTTTAAESKKPVDIYEGFTLADYYPADETADIVSISGVGGMINVLDEEKMAIARQGVIESEYYSEVIRQAKEIFTLENGNYTITAENKPFYADAYYNYFDSSEPYYVKPKMVYTIPINLGGEKGHVFVFSLPLPLKYAEWSGENLFYVPIYVTPDNKAIVINECCQQTMRNVEPIYVGEEFQLIFGSGHTQGTSLNIIVGFNESGYTNEYRGSAVKYTSWGGNYILDDMSVWYNEYRMLCYDKEKGYIDARSEKLSGEAMDIICSSPDVLAAYPDIAETCAAGHVYVTGGKYITVSGGGTFTFENGEFLPFDGTIHPSDDNFPSVAFIAQP